MSRSARLLGGLRMTYLHQGVTTLVGLWLTPFLLARLGEHDVGLWLLTTQITGFLLLMDLGIVAILPRDVAAVTGQVTAPEAQREAVTALLARTRYIVLRQWPLVALAALLTWFVLPDKWQDLRGPLGVVLCLFVFLFPTRLFMAALGGLQDFSYAGRVVVIAWAAQTAISILGVLGGLGLWSLALGWGAGQGLTAVIAWWRLRSAHRIHPFARRGRPPSAELRLAMRNGLWVSLSQVATVLLSGTDLLVIGAVLSPVMTVLYSSTGKLATVLANQPYAVVHTAMPALAELRQEGDAEHLRRVTSALALAMMIVSGGMAIVILAINGSFVRWWVGADQWGGFGLSTLLVVVMLLRHLSVSYAYTLFALSDVKWMTLMSLAEGGITVALMLVLVRTMGPVGAPTAALAALLGTSLPVGVWRMSVELRINPFQVVAPLLPWIVRFVPCAIAAAAVSRLVQPAGFLGIALVAGAAGAVYAVLLLPVALRSALGPYLRTHLPSRALAPFEPRAKAA